MSAGMGRTEPFDAVTVNDRSWREPGHELPMAPHQIDYVNEKLECIFTGRSVMKKTA